MKKGIISSLAWILIISMFFGDLCPYFDVIAAEPDEHIIDEDYIPGEEQEDGTENNTVQNTEEEIVWPTPKENWYEDYEYNLNNGNMYIRKSKGTITEEYIVIPATTTIDGTTYNVFLSPSSELGPIAHDSYNAFWNEGTNIKGIKIETGVKATDCAYLFYKLKSCGIVDIKGLDTSNARSMKRMFSESDVSIVDMREIDTSNVVDMSGMFESCYGITEIDMTGINTANVNDMNGMFMSCGNLTRIKDIEGFDTSNVKYMGKMFYGCKNLSNFDFFSHFDTSSVIKMQSLFMKCKNLEEFSFDKTNISNVTDLAGMFSGCGNLKTVDFSGADSRNISILTNLFMNCTSLTSINMSGLDLSNVTEADYVFDGCEQLNRVITPEKIGISIDLNKDFYDLKTGIMYNTISTYNLNTTLVTDLNEQPNPPAQNTPSINLIIQSELDSIKYYEDSGYDPSYITISTIVTPIKSINGEYFDYSEIVLELFLSDGLSFTKDNNETVKKYKLESFANNNYVANLKTDTVYITAKSLQEEFKILASVSTKETIDPVIYEFTITAREYLSYSVITEEDGGAYHYWDESSRDDREKWWSKIKKDEDDNYWNDILNENGDITWKWKMFKNATTYNKDMAMFCLYLSFLTYRDTNTFVNKLKEFGMDSVSFNHYETVTNDTPGRIFSHAKVEISGKTKNIFFIMIRGTQTVGFEGDPTLEKIWGSNFGDAGIDISSLWGGFKMAGNQIKSEFEAYLKEYDIKDYDSFCAHPEDNILLITGHSLGGGVSNYLAVAMEDFATREQTFVYTFAAARPFSKVFDLPVAAIERPNIFNIINEDDKVPRLSPTNYRVGNQYYFSSGDDDVRNAFEKNVVGMSWDNVKEDKEHISDIFQEWFWLEHVNPIYLSGILAKGNSWTGKHEATSNSGMAFIQCPVDVEVLDENNKLVGKISNNVIDRSVNTEVFLCVDGDHKIIMFPENKEYKLKLTGTDDGTMTYDVGYFDTITDELVSGRSYKNVVLTKGKSMLSVISIKESSNSEPRVSLFVTDEEGRITAEIREDGNEIESGNDVHSPMNPAMEITDLTKELYLVKGQKFYLPSNEWKSENKKYISINKKNLLTAKRATDKPIKLINGGRSIDVYVTKPAMAKKTIALQAGSSQLIGFNYDSEHMSVLYYSNCPDVATVSDNGMITAVAKGTVTITAYVNGSAYTCKVKVKEGTAALQDRTLHMTLKGRKTISIKGIKKVTWLSDDEKIVSVTKKNKITANASGETVLRTEYEGKEYRIHVFVENPTITTKNIQNAGKNKYKLTLKPQETIKIEFASIDQSVVFKSSKGETAYVDAYGNINVNGIGKTTLSAKVNGKTIKIQVAVSK